MSWIDIAWPMVAGACLTVAFINLRIGLAHPVRPASLLFSLSAFTAAAFAGIELALMRADTTARYWEVLPWLDVAAVVMVASITGFIWIFFGTANKWLALAGPGLSAVALVFDVLPGSRLAYRDITSLKTLETFGATYHVAEGVPNPWNAVGYAGVLLALVFVADASVRLWRRGGRRRAVVVGGSVLFFVLAAGAHSALVDAGIVQTPYLISWAYLAVLIAMARELTHDVFASGRFEGQLRESEQRFGAIADAAPVMIWMAGTDKLCTFFNHSWLAFTGRSLEQELGNGWAEGVHPADLDGCVRSYSEAFDVRRGFTIEYRLRRWDGEYRWILDSGTPRVAADGTFLGYVGSCVDVTELKRAQEHMRLAVEAAPNAMVMVNREGRIILLNAQAERVFGYDRDELLGRSVELLIPDALRSTHAVDRHEYVQAPVARAMGAGRDLRGRRKDGSDVPVEVGLNPIQTSDGTAILASIVDITARRALEAETARQRDQLAHLARVTMLGELSGSIAHELNQPLAAILTNAEAGLRFLARTPPDLEEVRSVLEDVVADDRRAGAVISRLRALLRKEEAQHRPLDVNEVALDVLRLMRNDLQHRHVQAVTDLAAGLPLVEGDRVQLQQVLINLLVNGSEAMNGAPTGRHLTIRTAAADGHVEVSVADRGTGIPPEDLERVFQPFVSTKAGGMGLGLAVCRTIVAAHQGRLWATNNPDHGATIHFTLPAAKAVPPPLP